MGKLASAGLETRDPEPWDSRRLWSLWDMLRFYASEFYNVASVLNRGRGSLEERKQSADGTLSPNDRKNIKSLLTSLDDSLQVLGAQVTRLGAQQLKWAVARKGKKAIKNKDVGKRLAEIDSRLRDELSLVHLFVLDKKNVDYFAPSETLFGKEFESKFTSAAFEVDEAAKCLALSRPTAAVFHLMRTMEVGVQAVRTALGIPTPVKDWERNWGQILRNINVEIDARNSATPKRWLSTTDKEFFESTYASLDAVRVAWRNPTMHVESKYTEDEAEHIFGAVRGFMKKLASRMDEAGKPLA